MGNALPSRYGPHYFMDNDVILITFNYRLGVFGKALVRLSLKHAKFSRIITLKNSFFSGYLSTQDEVLPGNYGIKDFVAVLKWVQENVDAFGGDKNRVTVAGGSSGGITSSLALVSPLTEGKMMK